MPTTIPTPQYDLTHHNDGPAAGLDAWMTSSPWRRHYPAWDRMSGADTTPRAEDLLTYA